MGIKINDDLYFMRTTKEFKQWANLMNIDYSDIPVNSSFKKKLYLRIKNHVTKFQQSRIK